MVSKVGKKIQEELLEKVLGPKCAKSGLFSKSRVSVRVRVRVSFSSCEMTTFDEPDGVQRWQSDSRRNFGTGFGPKVYKSGLFSKARVRGRVRVSFSRREMTTFDEPDGVQGWESDSRRIFGKGFRPKVYKSWLFSKARVSVRVRVRLAFQGVK